MKSVVKDSCQAFEFEDAIILPQVMVDNGPMWGLGGVCDSQGAFVESSFYDGGWSTHGGPYVWEEEDYVDSEVVYIGLFFQHWGHFLIDLLTRCWYLPIINNTAVKVAYLGDQRPNGNYLRFFELLGIREEQLINIKKPTRFRKVIVPEQAFKSCTWYTPEYVAMFDFAVKSAIQGIQKKCNYENGKIYLTRRVFPKAMQSEFGEEFFERVFTRNGYLAVAPEKLSLDEQIILWNSAKSIVCVNGTLPLNIVFCRNKELRLLVLNKTSLLHENPFILLHMRGVIAAFIDVYKEPLHGYPKSLGEGPYLFWESQEFDYYCQTNNLTIPLTKTARKRFFFKREMQYYWAVLGIKRRLWLWGVNHAPKWIKDLRRKLV